VLTEQNLTHIFRILVAISADPTHQANAYATNAVKELFSCLQQESVASRVSLLASLLVMKNEKHFEFSISDETYQDLVQAIKEQTLTQICADGKEKLITKLLIEKAKMIEQLQTNFTVSDVANQHQNKKLKKGNKLSIKLQPSQSMLKPCSASELSPTTLVLGYALEKPLNTDQPGTASSARSIFKPVSKSSQENFSHSLPDFYKSLTARILR
jgi:response regulator RpfG family c-di-GMP phosphodiesterase